MTSELAGLTFEAASDSPSRQSIGYWSGGIMLVTAAALWVAAFGQLRFLSPPITKLISSQLVKASEREKLAVWSFPWRGTGSETARLAALAAVVSVVVCVAIRTWWAWGATLVVAPLLVNWYITFVQLMPAFVVVDKMRY